ncbi:hypothetical protein FACS1894168_3750 [Deltaproteobacteria bacterium]|nr:hypothetical protein FACS1894168_3750 [Deltaproteobacteria bacterium]
MTQEVKRLADIFTFLGMSRKTVKEIYDALCHDWELEDHDR